MRSVVVHGLSRFLHRNSCSCDWVGRKTSREVDDNTTRKGLAQDRAWLQPSNRAGCLPGSSQLHQPQCPGHELVGLELEQKCGRRMELPARACWHPPTRMTAHIARRDMSAATEEEEMNGIGRETWIFFSSLTKCKAAAGSAREEKGSPHFCSTQHRQGQSMEQ